MNKREISKGVYLFDFIAPVYSLFFKYQSNMYDDILNKFHEKIFEKRTEYKILDTGCGTGALLQSLNKKNKNLTGIDPSGKMILHAKKNLYGTGIKLSNDNLMDKNPFSKNEFDIIFFSYVLHGLKKDSRIKLLNEALKIAGNKVVIIDYIARGGLFVDLIEWLEGGDYFNFVNEFKDELNALNIEYKIENIDGKSGLYLLYKK
jgi:ubiquinone/menaquinone biosynthesis C-methylase UbiE